MADKFHQIIFLEFGRIDEGAVIDGRLPHPGKGVAFIRPRLVRMVEIVRIVWSIYFYAQVEAFRIFIDIPFNGKTMLGSGA